MKRIWFANKLTGLGVARAILALRRRTVTPWLTVVTYHRVASHKALGHFDPDVATNEQDFEHQIAFLRETFDVVGMGDVLAATRGGTLPGSPLLITFDDGYRDNFDFALPLLKKHGVRATFFVATSYIDERRIFWWDRINYVLRTSTRPWLELTYPTPRALALGREANVLRAIDVLLDVVKTTYGLELPRFLDHLGEAAGVELDRTRERALCDEHVMTWDNIRALDRAGMDVGSHTSTHRVLKTLAPERFEAELRGSRSRLEDVLGRRVRAVAYPIGRDLLDSGTLRSAVRDAGYEVGFSNRSGVNFRSGFDALDLCRIPLEGIRSDPHFQALMAVPPLAY